MLRRDSSYGVPTHFAHRAPPVVDADAESERAAGQIHFDNPPPSTVYVGQQPPINGTSPIIIGR